MNDLQPGDIVRHFKYRSEAPRSVVGLYWVEALARDASNPAIALCVYRSIETGQWWVRPFAELCEPVTRGDYTGPRFLRVHPPRPSNLGE